DSTPLFVCLAGAYYRRTGDRGFAESIWPNVQQALHWIDAFGDRDGDGFVEYLRSSPNGLVQQGWKDSHDSVFHIDGTLAEGPIALCEVQGYAYSAKLAMSEVAAALGKIERAKRWRGEARKLQERFEQALWCDTIGGYALARDA